MDLSLRPHFMETVEESDPYHGDHRDREDDDGVGAAVGGLGYGGGRGYLQGQQQRRRMSIRSQNDRNKWPIPYLP